jgi:hypothetical protein
VNIQHRLDSDRRMKIIMAIFRHECFDSRRIVVLPESKPARRPERWPRGSSHRTRSIRMAKKTVLAIGIDPSFADRAARNSRPTHTDFSTMR